MKTTKLAAVLFSKIADFDMLLNSDNHRALRLLDLYKNLLEGILAEHDGECMDKTGEEYLVIFTSAVNAVQFAMHFELAIMTYNKGVSDNRERFQICIGVHLGEIWQEEGHVYGNGINIAARVMQAAEPGNILVSEDIERQVSNKLDIEFTEYEHAKLKNIARDLRVYRLGGESSVKPGGESPAKQEKRHETTDAPAPEVSVKPESLLSEPEINPLEYISEYFDSGHQKTSTGGKLPADFRTHIRETIRNTVAEAVRKSLQATQLAESNPGLSIVVNNEGEFAKIEDSVRDLDVTINLGMTEAEKQLNLAAKKLEGIDGLVARSTRPPRQSPEELRMEAKAMVSEGIVKLIAALGLGAASVFAYIKLDNVLWLVCGAIVGLFPALSAIKKIRLGTEKRLKAIRSEKKSLGQIQGRKR